MSQNTPDGHPNQSGNFRLQPNAQLTPFHLLKLMQYWEEDFCFQRTSANKSATLSSFYIQPLTLISRVQSTGCNICVCSRKLITEIHLTFRILYSSGCKEYWKMTASHSADFFLPTNSVNKRGPTNLRRSQLRDAWVTPLLCSRIGDKHLKKTSVDRLKQLKNTHQMRLHACQ